MNEFTSLQRIIDDAIRKIVVNDDVLIKKGQEWALSNKLGMYLFPHFPGWDVDCEYNRVGFENELKRTSANDYKRPDVIIHKRGCPERKDNLLWIEVKVSNSDVKDDIEKLREFTSPPTGARKIQYKYGLSLSFVPNIITVWIENGTEKKVDN